MYVFAWKVTYCSVAKLSQMRPQSSDIEHGQSAIYLSSSQDSESSGEEQAAHTTVPPPLIDLSSSDGQRSDKEQEPGQSKRPRLVDVALTPTSLEITDPAATPAEEIITISSCSEGEDKAKSTTPSRKPYAMRMADLPPELQRFLNDARSFFTRAHSLERHGQQVAVSTYMKAEERILCKYFTFIVTSGIARISFFLFLFFAFVDSSWDPFMLEWQESDSAFEVDRKTCFQSTLSGINCKKRRDLKNLHEAFCLHTCPDIGEVK